MHNKKALEEQQLKSVMPAVIALIQTMAGRLGVNVPSQIGAMEDLYKGDGSGGPNVVGHTSDDPDPEVKKRIYVDYDNFENKIRNLDVTPTGADVKGFFNEGIGSSPEEKNSAIIVKLNVLKYVMIMLFC